MKPVNLLLQTLTLTGLLFSYLLYAGTPANEQCPSPAKDETRPEVLTQWVFDHERELKEKGCWRQHLELGKEALAFKGLGSEVAERLRLQMASSAFFLGDYPLCGELAAGAYENALKRGDTKGQVEGLYLLSAASRAMHKPDAVPLARKALALLNRTLSGDLLLLAKVLYNLGAVLTDGQQKTLNGLKEAGSAFHQASRLFLREGYDRDALRSGIRLARVDYLEGYYQQAKSRMDALESLKSRVNTPRTDMQFDYQMAKILSRLQRWSEASQYAHRAQTQAKALSARADIERIHLLLDAINDRRFLEE